MAPQCGVEKQTLWCGQRRRPLSIPHFTVPASHCAPTGFSLLEVLVVVAILALLLAILLPGLSKAREQSRRVVCQSNLREIARAWHMYLEENSGCFFQLVNANVNYGGQQGAVVQYQRPKPLNKFFKLPPVTKQAEVFHCPSDRGTNLARPTCYAFYGTSYNTNLMLIGQNQFFVNPTDPCRPVMMIINQRIRGLHRNRVTANHSRLVLMGDFGWVNAWHFASTQRAEWHGRPFSYNLAFMDGHVGFVCIRKGLHVTADYTVIPFRNLQDDALECQCEEEDVP